MQDVEINEAEKADSDDIEEKFSKELEKYTSMCDSQIDLAQFWSENAQLFPILSKLAYVVFSVPPSSASCERNFSHLKFILRENRLNIDRNYICKLMIAKDSLH